MKLTTYALLGSVLAAAVGAAAVAAESEGPTGAGPGMGRHGPMWHGGFNGMGRGPGHWGHGAGLKALDTDNDGDVTLAEFLKSHEQRFAEIDANKDGSIDAAEITAFFKAAEMKRSERMMKRLDANGDGKVTREEFTLAMAGGPRGHGGRHGGKWHKGEGRGVGMGPGPGMGHDMGPGMGPGMMGGMGGMGGTPQPGGTAQAPESVEDGSYGWGGPHGGKRGGRAGGMGQPMTAADIETRFKALDKNGDGALDKAEIEAAGDEMIAWRVKHMLHVHDKNGDGKITREEFVAEPTAHFARMDLNNDGKITADDLPPFARERWARR